MTWRKLGTSQLCSRWETHHSALFWAVGSLKNASSVSKHCASVKPIQALPQHKTSARMSDVGKVSLQFLWESRQGENLAVSIYSELRWKEKLFYFGAVAVNKVMLNQRVLQKQWIPSRYANSCLVLNTRAAWPSAQGYVPPALSEVLPPLVTGSTLLGMLEHLKIYLLLT